jgi:hypothetical protein
MGYGNEEFACGRDGEIESPERRSYANDQLYKSEHDGNVIFWDQNVADTLRQPRSLTQSEIDADLACYDSY